MKTGLSGGKTLLVTYVNPAVAIWSFQTPLQRTNLKRWCLTKWITTILSLMHTRVSQKAAYDGMSGEVHATMIHPGDAFVLDSFDIIVHKFLFQICTKHVCIAILNSYYGNNIIDHL